MDYTNNSVVTITEIGTGSAALHCTTTLLQCCFSGQGGANGWFFPSGDGVMRDESLPYYRTREQYPGRLLLHRNPEATTTGIFRCDIPDASNELQSLYVGIYTNTTGKSCTLIVWLFSGRYPSRTLQFMCLYSPQLQTVHSNLTILWYIVC